MLNTESTTTPLPAAQALEPEDISNEIATILKESPVPSLAAAAVVDGYIVSTGASGIRKKGSSTKVTVTDKYHIGSCTKSMTASLTAILVEQGNLKWDTTISEVFSDINVHQGYRDVTLRQLLTNTGGVPENINLILRLKLWRANGGHAAQRLQLVSRILSKPPSYQAGIKFEYSNSGFSIAGAMLEKVMGETYEDLLTRLLFDPLSMKSAGFRAPASQGLVDQPYGHGKLLFMVSPIEPEPGGDNPAATAPAGAVHCSVIDFAKYAQFQLGALGKLQMLPQPDDDLIKASVFIKTRGHILSNEDIVGIQNLVSYAIKDILPKKVNVVDGTALMHGTALERSIRDKITKIDKIQHSLVQVAEKKNGDGMKAAVFVHTGDHVMNSDLILEIKEIVSASVDGLKISDITVVALYTWMMEDDHA